MGIGGGNGGGGSAGRADVYDPFKTVKITEKDRKSMEKMKTDQDTRYGPSEVGEVYDPFKMSDITEKDRAALHKMKSKQSERGKQIILGGTYDYDEGLGLTEKTGEYLSIFKSDKAQQQATGQWNWADKLSEMAIRGTIGFGQMLVSNLLPMALGITNPAAGAAVKTAFDITTKPGIDYMKARALKNMVDPEGAKLTPSSKADIEDSDKGSARTVLMRTAPGQTMRAQSGGATERKAKEIVKAGAPEEKEPRKAEKKAARGVLSGRQTLGKTSPLGIPPLKNRRRLLMGT